MNPEYDIHEQIDLYLDNKLSGEALSLFNSKLANDVDLQEMVEAQKMANEIIFDNEMIRLKDRMREDLSNDGTSGKSNLNKIIISSLLIISASVGGYVYLSSDSQQSKGKLLTDQKETDYNAANSVVSEDNSKDKNEFFRKPSSKEKLSVVLEDTTKENFSNGTPENLLSDINNSGENSSENQITKPEIKENLKEENNKYNCNEIKIDGIAKVNVGFNTNEGTIIIDKKTVRGGKAPYLFSIDKETFTASSQFEYVQEGTYTIYIKDHNNCICSLSKPVVVKSETPTKEIDDVFSPINGDRWKFPLGQHSEGSINIFNKGGSLVYNANIVGGYPAEWDGRDVLGNELGTGNYYFIINFTQNEMVRGHITIVR
jgi:hypothetical protein